MAASRGKPLQRGKLPVEVLRRAVLGAAGAPSPLVVTGPKPGLDFAAIRLGKKYLIVSADPITGASRRLGEYAVEVSANDVATSGNRPQFAESILLLPEGWTERSVSVVAAQVDSAAKRLGISVVGGHTEITPGLERPIAAVTAFAVADRYVSSDQAEAGDSIMMTKSAGIEGTAVIAAESGRVRRRLPKKTLERAERLASSVSVVEEAARGFETGSVHAMHDCTEGGVLGAVFEMSVASGLGFSLEPGLVPVAPETRAVCDALSLDPLKLIGSGSLLMSVEKGSEDRVAAALEPLCLATVIGRFAKSGRVMVGRSGKVAVREAPEDELWRALTWTG